MAYSSDLFCACRAGKLFPDCPQGIPHQAHVPASLVLRAPTPMPLSLIVSPQGIHTKAAQAAAFALRCPIEVIRVAPTSSLTSPSSLGTGGTLLLLY